MNLDKIPEPHRSVLELFAKSFPTLERSKIWAVLQENNFNPHMVTSIFLSLQEEQHLSNTKQFQPHPEKIQSQQISNPKPQQQPQQQQQQQRQLHQYHHQQIEKQQPSLIDNEFTKEFERLRAKQNSGLLNKNLLDSSINFSSPIQKNNNNQPSNNKTNNNSTKDADIDFEAELEKLRRAQSHSLKNKSMLDSSVNLSKSRLAENHSVDLNRKKIAKEYHTAIDASISLLESQVNEREKAISELSKEIHLAKQQQESLSKSIMSLSSISLGSSSQIPENKETEPQQHVPSMSYAPYSPSSNNNNFYFSGQQQQQQQYPQQPYPQHDPTTNPYHPSYPNTQYPPFYQSPHAYAALYNNYYYNPSSKQPPVNYDYHHNQK